MQSQSLTLKILVLLTMTGIPVRAASVEYNVRHDHMLKSCQGKLIVGDQEIRYEATDGKHSQVWPYIDIQKLDVVSPTEIILKSFKSASWKKLGKDEAFEFSL